MAGDIVELSGGAAAILQRAQEKFASGRNEEALHLLDIVRDADADTTESRTLGVRIHEALLKRTDNFWLSSWLKNEIKSLQA